MKKILRTLLFISVTMIASEALSQTVPVWKRGDLQKAIDSAKGPTVINFWATFCKPCITELPYFQAMANKYKSQGLNLIFVSLDLKEAFPKIVTAFIKKRNLTSPVVFLDESNADLFVPAVDSTWSGAIPATLFLNSSKNYRLFLEEELSKERLEVEVRKMMGE